MIKMSQSAREELDIVKYGLDLVYNGGSCEGMSLKFMSLTFEKTSLISLSCKLVPVQYREYE